MNKKVMALAVAGALSAPALALAQVQIGGSLTILYYQHDPKNSNVAQKGDILESSEPELYFRASEKLGGGLEAWFQCASSMDGFIGGGGAVADSGWCARNSAFGFRGGFGNIFLGNWDTPTKLLQNRIRGWFSGTNALVGGGFTLLGNSSASGVTNPTVATAASPVAGAISGTATVVSGGTRTNNSFYRRQANSVNYHSPNWGGFSLQAAYSANNESTGIPETSALTPRLWGINGVFATGPFWVGVAYEKHDDYNPSAVLPYTGGTDDNITIGAGVTFGGFNIRAAYSESNYEPTSTTELEAKGMAVYADWNIAGPHTIRAAFITLDDIGGNSTRAVGFYRPSGSATGGEVMTFAYSYAFSKRTELFLAWNQMRNDSNATFNMGKAAVTVGGKQRSAGLGLKHSF